MEQQIPEFLYAYTVAKMGKQMSDLSVIAVRVIVRVII